MTDLTEIGRREDSITSPGISSREDGTMDHTKISDKRGGMVDSARISSRRDPITDSAEISNKDGHTMSSCGGEWDQVPPRGGPSSGACSWLPHRGAMRLRPEELSLVKRGGAVSRELANRA
ncbi:hypothetical protein NDA11_004433 [Ustilago hordei]|uniref:Uncharacterized protein n=1 Tax=Ustilago hordei TaxID=120017 RepID=I2FVC2_USTHO|nr:uncharacterized protein UHO2_04399 [Ustilago hordei]KAJ1578137.1 hypothetical protein NDA12_005833 [Ustilago hordei]KAJ1578368.1 hypothetical protein NDA11_004433 [Ustilago hordei]KAJ1592499.1 hypothetical protein NDA15_003763 [Ustilago hordei]CCF50865.1 uncharacterized protein UHOR_06744 [Ustilago hordei]SYW84460.1 uncharacterized protein UHO2_04399 [Ustilago hordei]